MEKEDAWAVTFCYVLAPTLFLYVLWVLDCAIKDEKQRLYFLARDGYMMYFIAKFICNKWEIPLECRYLYCSRYSLRSGEYFLLQEKSLDYICMGGMNVTFESLMKRGGLKDKEAYEIGKSMGVDMKKQLSYEQIKAFYPRLKEYSLFMEKVFANAEEQYPLVIGYLRQEGLLEDIPYGVVDSGWTGSIQKSLNHLLKSSGQSINVEGYYFGMYEYATGVDKELYQTYYFSPKGDWLKKSFFCNNLFECIFSSPEGMTKGYRKEEGRFVPILEQAQNPNGKRIQNSTELFKRYAEIYTNKYTYEMCEKKCSRAILLDRKVISRLLSSFMGHPSTEEANVYGSYVFCDDITGEENQWIAAPLSDEELKENRVLQRFLRYMRYKSRPTVLSAWPEGSTVLAGNVDFMQTAVYKYLLYARKSVRQLCADARRNGREKAK